MFSLKLALGACALAFVQVFGVAAMTAQPYAHPETVYLPLGKTQVVRVVSVASILRHFTAADLEMKPGDLVFALDGERVDSAEQFNEAFAKKTTDANTRLDFLRGGVVHQSVGPLFRFTRGVFKSDKPRWGGDLATDTAEFTRALLEKPVVRSILALELGYVNANSAASNAGLQKKDLLLSVNGRSLGSASRSDILVPLFAEGTLLNFVYLRDGQMREGKAPLTVVKTGLAKTLSFGFAGDSRMVELPGSDLPEELPHDVKVEIPAQ